MPSDPIAAFLMGVGIDPEALVFALVMATITTLGIACARAAANR